MRWRPRFSLRTLVVFLLLVTSGLGLWLHWRPWEVEKVLEGGMGPEVYSPLVFSLDGSAIAASDLTGDLRVVVQDLNRLMREIHLNFLNLGKSHGWLGV